MLHNARMADARYKSSLPEIQIRFSIRFSVDFFEVFTSHIFCQRTRHDDHVQGNGAELFDSQIDHSTQDNVFRLEQFGHREEAICRFSSSQNLALRIKLKKIGGFIHRVIAATKQAVCIPD